MAIFEKNEDDKKQAKGSGVLAAHLRAVLVKPRVSEKAVRANNAGKYIFEVLKSANKISVKKAIEGIYNVKVVQVNMISMEGKKRNYGRTSGTMSDFKKAIVTLKSGDKIEIGEAV